MAIQNLSDIIATVTTPIDTDLLLIENAGAHKSITHADLLVLVAKLAGADFTGSVNVAGNVGIGTTSPKVSAALDMGSVTKGLLLPQLTTVERDALTLAFNDEGLIIYNISTRVFNIWNGVFWKVLNSTLDGKYGFEISEQGITASISFQPSVAGTNVSLTVKVVWTGYTAVNTSASSGEFMSDFSWDGTTLTQSGTPTEIYFNNNSGDVLTVTLVVLPSSSLKIQYISDAGMSFNAQITWITTKN